MLTPALLKNAPGATSFVTRGFVLTEKPEGPTFDDREGILDFANYILSILISLIVGLVGFVAAYKIFDWLTPGVNFSDQLNADNRSVAIFLAGLFVGLGLLLGNAIK